jgi:hypothetical protein
MEKKRNACRVLVGKPEVKKPHGRIKCGHVINRILRI